MDSREELPRVSVGSVQDWQKMKNNYKEAAMDQVQQYISTSNISSQEKDLILAHLDQVCFPNALCLDTYLYKNILVHSKDV